MLRDSRVWFDAVRPGLLLYGVAPPPLATTRAAAAGDAAASAASWRPRACGRANRSATARGTPPTPPRRIAVVPAGYADGLDLRLAGRGHVLVGGRRAPIVGAVSWT